MGEDKVTKYNFLDLRPALSGVNRTKLKDHPLMAEVDLLIHY